MFNVLFIVLHIFELHISTDISLERNHKYYI